MHSVKELKYAWLDVLEAALKDAEKRLMELNNSADASLKHLAKNIPPALKESYTGQFILIIRIIDELFDGLIEIYHLLESSEYTEGYAKIMKEPLRNLKSAVKCARLLLPPERKEKHSHMSEEDKKRIENAKNKSIKKARAEREKSIQLAEELVELLKDNSNGKDNGNGSPLMKIGRNAARTIIKNKETRDKIKKIRYLISDKIIPLIKMVIKNPMINKRKTLMTKVSSWLNGC